MGKKSPKPPAPPDPVATANAQAAANKDAAIAAGIVNNPNQVTPWGSLTWTQGPTEFGGTPRFTANVRLTPEQQALLDLENRTARSLGELGASQIDRVSGALSQPYNTAGLPELPGDMEDYRRQIAQVMYDRINPQFDRDEERIRTRLAAQGGTQLGNAGANEEFERFDRARNDARLGIEAGASEEARRELSSRMALRDKAINERLFERNLPLQEVSQLLWGQGAPQFPQWAPYQGQGVPAAPYADLVMGNYANQLAAFNQQQQSRNSALGGLFGLAGSIGGGLLGGPFGASLGGLLGGGLAGGGGGAASGNYASRYRMGPWGGG